MSTISSVSATKTTPPMLPLPPPPSKTSSIEKLQAIFRGNRSREVHYSRAKAKANIVCPFYPCSQAVLESISNLIKDLDVDSDDVIIDLGCGDGCVLQMMAKNFGSNCIGYDIDRVLCETARRRMRDDKIDHLVQIYEQDIETVDLSNTNATIIFIFLVPSCLHTVSNILKEQSKHFKSSCSSIGGGGGSCSGSNDNDNNNNNYNGNRGKLMNKRSSSVYIIAYKFPLPEIDWKPLHIIETEDVVNPSNKTHLYMYCLPICDDNNNKEEEKEEEKEKVKEKKGGGIENVLIK